MKKFWNWTNETDENNPNQKNRTLYLNGTIAEESWYDDDVTPQLFKDDLYSDSGDVTVWLNSPGGDCIAAAQIYNMLKEYPGNITIKVDGIAASAASLIAMAGDEVLMSPVSMMMIHNPLTVAIGNADDMQKAASMLEEVKNSIINAYELKTGLSRSKLSHLMDNETWMNAVKAVELGFADGILYHNNAEDDAIDTLQTNTKSNEKATFNNAAKPMMFSRQQINLDLIDKINKHFEKQFEKPKETENQGRSVDTLMDRLNLLKY